MIKIGVLTANLGNFDVNVDNKKQNLREDVEMTFHRWDDKNFPPCAGLTPRMQYRIPKMFGWQMFPGYDYYLWMDGSFTMQHPNSLMYFFDWCKDHDVVVFKHPHRNSIKEEVTYIEWKLSLRNLYISKRYQNGFHKEQLEVIEADKDYKDDKLYTSTVFFYRNTLKVQQALCFWWYHSSRFFTCDQVVEPYAFWKLGLKVQVLKTHQYHNRFVKLTSPHP
jgi:hypothetical protein